MRQRPMAPPDRASARPSSCSDSSADCRRASGHTARSVAQASPISPSCRHATAWRACASSGFRRQHPRRWAAGQLSRCGQTEHTNRSRWHCAPCKPARWKESRRHSSANSASSWAEHRQRIAQTRKRSAPDRSQTETCSGRDRIADRHSGRRNRTRAWLGSWGLMDDMDHESGWLRGK